MEPNYDAVDNPLESFQKSSEDLEVEERIDDLDSKVCAPLLKSINPYINTSLF